MSENYIPISNINDFIFCPASIYFHSLDSDTDLVLLQSDKQLNGSAIHKRVDEAEYSDSNEVLQAIPVISEVYGVFGKIDVFNTKTGVLTERKKKIRKIYDGYVFQLYAQYFALSEMGYDVSAIRLYSYDDNKTYNIELPDYAPDMFMKFKDTLANMNAFSLRGFSQSNKSKCDMCIYEPMCAFAAVNDHDVVE